MHNSAENELVGVFFIPSHSAENEQYSIYCHVYPLKQYGTFEEYCKGKWDISRPRAYELMKAAEVKENLSATADIPERQLRPLTRIKDPDEQREVYRKGSRAPSRAITYQEV